MKRINLINFFLLYCSFVFFSVNGMENKELTLSNQSYDSLDDDSVTLQEVIFVDLSSDSQMQNDVYHNSSHSSFVNHLKTHGLHCNPTFAGHSFSGLHQHEISSVGSTDKKGSLSVKEILQSSHPQTNCFFNLNVNQRNEFKQKFYAFNTVFEKVIEVYTSGKIEHLTTKMLSTDNLSSLMMDTKDLKGYELRAAQEFNRLANKYVDELKTVLYDSDGNIKLYRSTQDEREVVTIYGDFLQEAYGEHRGFEIAEQLAEKGVSELKWYVDQRSGVNWLLNKVKRVNHNRKLSKNIGNQNKKIEASNAHGFNKGIKQYFDLRKEGKIDQAYQLGQKLLAQNPSKHLKIRLEIDRYGDIKKRYNLPHSQAIQKAVYALIRQQKTNPDQVIEYFVNHFTQDHENFAIQRVSELLFDKNGILRGLKYDPKIFDGIIMPQSINNEANVEKRALLNNLVVQAQNKSTSDAANLGVQYFVAAMKDEKLSSEYIALAQHVDKSIQEQMPFLVPFSGNWAVEYKNIGQQKIQNIVVPVLADMYSAVINGHVQNQQSYNFKLFNKVFDNIHDLQKVVELGDMKKATAFLQEKVLEPLADTPGFEYAKTLSEALDQSELYQSQSKDVQLMNDVNDPNLSLDFSDQRRGVHQLDIDKKTYDSLMQDPSLPEEYKQLFAESYQNWQKAQDEDAKSGYANVTQFYHLACDLEKNGQSQLSQAFIEMGKASAIILDQCKIKVKGISEFGKNLLDYPFDTLKEAVVHVAKGCAHLIKATSYRIALDIETTKLLFNAATNTLNPQDISGSKLLESHMQIMSISESISNLSEEKKIRLATDVAFDLATMHVGGKAFAHVMEANGVFSGLKNTLAFAEVELGQLAKCVKSSEVLKVAELQKMIKAEVEFAGLFEKSAIEAERVAKEILAVSNPKISPVVRAQKLAQLQSQYGASKINKLFDRLKFAQEPVFITPEGIKVKTSSPKLSNVMKQEMQQGGNIDKVLPKKANIINKFEITEDLIEHMFSKKHKRNDIMKLGKTEKDIANKFVKIVLESDARGLLIDGSNQIHAVVNQHEVVIRLFIKDGEVLSFNSFIGKTNRNLGNVFTFKESR